MRRRSPKSGLSAPSRSMSLELKLAIVAADCRVIVSSRCAFHFKRLAACPMQIICDNGTEFTGKAMFFWNERHAANIDVIQPGKPTLQRLCGDLGRQVSQ